MTTIINNINNRSVLIEFLIHFNVAEACSISSRVRNTTFPRTVRLAKFLVYLIDLLVNPLRSASEFVWLRSDHLNKLRHFLAADLRETRQRFHARVQLLLRWAAVEVLQQRHCQLHGNIVEHLRGSHLAWEYLKYIERCRMSMMLAWVEEMIWSIVEWRYDIMLTQIAIIGAFVI